MATYAIGDIQGCFQELQELLRVIKYNQKHDQLWFVGDLVNRGPDSLDTLRFIRSLDNVVVVLGNHDLHLLAVFHAKDPLKINHNLDAIIKAKDAEQMIDWLRQQPLLHYDSKLNYVMTHAGIYPFWALAVAKLYASEVEKVLRRDNYVEFLHHMYGNLPNVWDEGLQGFERCRFILHAFTRMRFCSLTGVLNFEKTGIVDTAPPGFLPWFKIPDRKTKGDRIVFGHWAALGGVTNEPNVFALDTGCVWGGRLTAMRLDDGRVYGIAKR